MHTHQMSARTLALLAGTIALAAPGPAGAMSGSYNYQRDISCSAAAYFIAALLDNRYEARDQMRSMQQLSQAWLDLGVSKGEKGSDEAWQDRSALTTGYQQAYYVERSSPEDRNAYMNQMVDVLDDCDHNPPQ